MGPPLLLLRTASLLLRSMKRKRTTEIPSPLVRPRILIPAVASILIHKPHLQLRSAYSVGTAQVNTIPRPVPPVRFNQATERDKKKSPPSLRKRLIRGRSLRTSPKTEYVDHFGWRAAVDLSGARGSLWCT
ncbi:hypothetical protein P170DRAFT_248785 [Aspergillus steynii IBT 23096]|uniref:Uncharacterized protein n=1 Tax=Aspergillus steynii IBT 23096 TaxID=1392250 RepID=A0A2I2FYF4_9EURO|nr:uncharacterized protein P170DRAFT_248785 [Aspergillus steynii IBT 23096]PLB45663.1 hypothetical protein P170DRAFT_248785 [Aspergillus steynii IBT 23096]